MANYYYLSSRTKLKIFCSLLLQTCVILLISQRAFARSEQPLQKPSLKTLREIVAANESLVTLIKMNCKIQYTKTGEPQKSRKKGIQYGRTMGREYTHRDITWAQDGIKQHCSNSFFYSPDKLASETTQVIDGEVWKWAKGPDLMLGKIDYIDRFSWVDIGVVFLGLRPFEGKHLLSEILVPEYSSIHNETAIIDGRETYIVDAKKPTEPVYFGRIWFDCTRGMPLCFEYYDRHPDIGQARLLSRVESIKLHQLPNGGWVPVEGIRTLPFKERVISTHISVDVNSITTRKEDIPDSLFTLEFPEKAQIYNAIVGVANRGGKIDEIIDDYFETLYNSGAEPGVAPSSELGKQEPTKKYSQQTTKQPLPNETGHSRIQPPKPFNPLKITKQGFTLASIFLPSLLFAFGVVVMVWIIKNRYKTTNRKEPKQ